MQIRNLQKQAGHAKRLPWGVQTLKYRTKQEEKSTNEDQFAEKIVAPPPLRSISRHAPENMFYGIAASTLEVVVFIS